MTPSVPPFAELHLHLEGSIEPQTLQELNPALSDDEINRCTTFSDFPGFIEAFKWTTGFLRTPSDYALITRRLVERLAAQNVVYAEITLAAGVVLWKQLDFDAVWQAVRDAARHDKVEVNWVLDAIRHFGPEHVMQVARLAADRAGHGVVAFGLGGDESRGHAQDFREAFALCRSARLKLVPHAGENTSAESVWSAVRAGAHRIGHGIRAVEDPRLIAYLRDHQIPLEICLSSNVATGAVASIDEHPIRRIFDAVVPIVLNTDDPALFRTSLAREYELAASHFGFTPRELDRIAANAFLFAAS